MAVGRRAAPAVAGATKLTPGARTGIAAGVFVAAVLVSALGDHFFPSLPQAAVAAWYAAAAAGAIVLALALPSRAAVGLALTAALITGTLTYSHPAREKTAAGVAAVGSAVGGWIHDLKMRSSG